MTRGRCGSLTHIRMTFAFTTPRRFSRRTGEPYDYGKRHVAKAVCELSDLERRYFMHAGERALCRLCGECTDSGRISTANWIGSDRQRRLERPGYREPCEIAVLQAAQCACARCHDR